MDAKVKAKELPKDISMVEVIDRCITSRDDHYEKIKESLTEILEDIFTTIKGQSRFFREHYQGFFLLEQYYKGPKVIQPEEFDANLIIKIPIDNGLIRVHSNEHGFKEIEVNIDQRNLENRLVKYSTFLKQWGVETNSSLGFRPLSSIAFRWSIQSLLAGAIVLNLPSIDNYRIKAYEGTSAFSLCMMKQDLPEMKINITPVIQFKGERLASGIDRGLDWYLAPQCNITAASPTSNFWRLVLYNQENKILTRHSYFAPVIRLLEKLRDTQKWTTISCDHIKILSLHYTKEMETESGLPVTGTLTGMKLFVHMLYKLRDMCKTARLPDFFNCGRKLLDAPTNELQDIARQLTTIIDEITVDPNSVAKWILTEEELRTNQEELNAVGIFQYTSCLSEHS